MSDNETLLILGLVAFLGLIMMFSALQKSAQIKQQEENAKEEHCKRIEWEKSQKEKLLQSTKNEDNSPNNDKICIFCGESMPETQVFCGACGRRQD